MKRYTLLKVPYNDGEGGEPTPLLGADDGKSNFAPRFSPDGEWIVFCKAEAASLVEPTSDLWIISTEDGARARKLECNHPRAMDSHHSWSSESRWLLFASKRDDGIFARIYLTEIDERGHASPPVELPTHPGIGETDHAHAMAPLGQLLRQQQRGVGRAVEAPAGTDLHDVHACVSAAPTEVPRSGSDGYARRPICVVGRGTGVAGRVGSARGLDKRSFTVERALGAMAVRDEEQASTARGGGYPVNVRVSRGRHDARAG